MNSKELLKLKLAGKPTERNLFCPAIYEHKARLINRSVSEVAGDIELLKQAIFAEYEIYQPDMLMIGIDIYNVEAQALGAEIVWPDAQDIVPHIKEKILCDISEVENLKMPEISHAGRIPMFLEAAQYINHKLERYIPVRGVLSGPCSIAAELMGIEPLIMAMILEPEKINKLLDFTTSFVINYGKEYIKRGLSVCLFDSQASPPLLSPDMFNTFLLPRLRQIAQEFKAAGCEFTELVIGGQTDPIAGYMLESGFDIVLCDYPCNVNVFFENRPQSGPLIRRNINPVLIEQGNFEALQKKTAEVKQLGNKFNNVIFGTGVLSYNVSTENILKVKQMSLES